jgi:APA family basic amino acid/polyamine antiporter
MAVAGVLVLRHSHPHMTRSFSVPGYPWLSLLFCFAAAGVILGTLIARLIGALIGIGLVATGIPVYLFCIKIQSATTSE